MWPVKINESGFKYVESYGGPHDCKRVRIYIKAVCNLPDKLTFPLIGHKIIKSAKGTHIIIPDERFCIHHVEVHSGYRGNAEIKIDDPLKNETQIAWDTFHSPQGNLGLTANLITSINYDRVIAWTRSGRRIEGDESAGEMVLRVDGSITSWFDPELEDWK